MGGLNGGDLTNDILVVSWQVSDAGEGGNSLVDLATLDQVTGGFVLEEGEAEDQPGKDDMKTGRNLLLAVSLEWNLRK